MNSGLSLTVAIIVPGCRSKSKCRGAGTCTPAAGSGSSTRRASASAAVSAWLTAPQAALAIPRHSDDSQLCTCNMQASCCSKQNPEAGAADRISALGRHTLGQARKPAARLQSTCTRCGSEQLCCGTACPGMRHPCATLLQGGTHRRRDRGRCRGAEDRGAAGRGARRQLPQHPLQRRQRLPELLQHHGIASSGSGQR